MCSSDLEFEVKRGRGYRPASEEHKNEEDQEIGWIAVDAIFSPVQRVRYRVEDVGLRNEIADYFGEIELLQSDEPTLSAQYVLIVPKTRTLEVHASPLPGLAREVKAALGGQWTAWAQRLFAATPTGTGHAFDLAVEDDEDCPSYFAQLVEGVKVAPSPDWLVARLASVGQRSVNNIVDLTNLVLFGAGQPLHAFDAAKLDGPAIRVRRALPGETITTLDGKARVLNPEVLVIADASRPVAIAGVMGGADSEVTDATTSILLECAVFRGSRVRRGAKSLDLATEASKRYERGVDPNIGAAAAAQFLALLLELCPGAKLGPMKRLRTAPPPRTLTLRPSRCERLIGLPFTADRCADLLESLEFGVQRGETLTVTVPTWRSDVSLEDDLVEEVARSNGYDRIPEAPLETGGAYAVRSPRERVVRRARESMLALGFHEAWCGSLEIGRAHV